MNHSISYGAHLLKCAVYGNGVTLNGKHHESWKKLVVFEFTVVDELRSIGNQFNKEYKNATE